MSAKMMKISVLAVLVVVGLGGGYLASVFIGPSEQESEQLVSGAEATKTMVELPAGVSEFIAVQPKQSPINDLVNELRYLIKENKKKELEFKRREEQIAIAKAYFKDEEKKLRELRTELNAPLLRLTDEIAKLERSRIQISSEETIHMQKIADRYATMSADNGAQTLIKLCENRNEEDAVKILYYMDEKKGGKLLDAMSDKDLVSKLLLKMKVIREEG